MSQMGSSSSSSSSSTSASGSAAAVPVVNGTMASAVPQPNWNDDVFRSHMELLSIQSKEERLREVGNAPIFTVAAQRALATMAEAAATDPAALAELSGPALSQYGLLGGDSAGLRRYNTTMLADPRVFQNVATPASVFICGSQGSGKSHTLSCLLENALLQTSANKLPKPLTGLVFHYDNFYSDTSSQPCEAAFLASHRSVKKLYGNLGVKVLPLLFADEDLNAERLMALMCVSNEGDGKMPLYIHVVNRVIRDMRMLEQRIEKKRFTIAEFKRRVKSSNLSPGQSAPFEQRLETLESFLADSKAGGINWNTVPGELTIVDLSCPCVTPETACLLFGMSLALFIEKSQNNGRIIALDEAHRYLSNAAESESLTEQLLKVVRLQRHLGIRVIISTQEPTISPKLLDLCSVTIVHRFTSPSWIKTLVQHLAGAAISGANDEVQLRVLKQEDGENAATKEKRVVGLKRVGGVHVVSATTRDKERELFAQIVDLRVGEAMVFSATAVIDVVNSPGADGQAEAHIVRLGSGILKIQVRQRVTAGGGLSKMAA